MTWHDRFDRLLKAMAEANRPRANQQGEAERRSEQQAVNLQMGSWPKSAVISFADYPAANRTTRSADPVMKDPQDGMSLSCRCSKKVVRL